MQSFLQRLLPFALCFSVLPASADALDAILERGTLRVGVAEFVPWTMRNGNGDLVGFEVDMANKIASDMGVAADFRVYAWPEIIPALQEGEIDIIAGGMAITPQRALKVNFTRPTAESGIGIATNTEMTREIRDFAALNSADVIVATVADTYASSVAQLFVTAANVNTVRTVAQAEEQVLNGRAHVYLAGFSEARFLALKHPDVVDVPVSEPLVAQSEAMAVKKGEQELLHFLNAWVTARQTDEWLPTTRDYWFDSMAWAFGGQSRTGSHGQAAPTGGQ